MGLLLNRRYEPDYVMPEDIPTIDDLAGDFGAGAPAAPIVAAPSPAAVAVAQPVVQAHPSRLIRDNSAFLYGGQPVAMGNPADVMKVANANLPTVAGQSQIAASPDQVMGVTDGGDGNAPVLNVKPGELQIQSPAAPTTPMRVGKPTFQQATTDQYGNQRPINGSLTKLGVLMSILKAGAQGASDAMAAGALDAVPGRSAFGAGFAAASPMGMPRVRRQQAFQNQQQEMELEQMRQNVQPVQTPWGVMPLWKASKYAQMGKDIAETNAANANASRRNFLAVPGVGVAKINDDGSTSIVQARQQPANLQQLYAQAVQDANKRGVKSEDDPTAQSYADAITSLQKKSQPTTPFGAWYAAKLAKGETPTEQQILDFQKQNAQATHITVNGGAVDPTDMQTIVGGLVDGTLDVKGVFSRLSAPQRIQAIAAAKRIDPSFDMTNFAARQKVATEFAGGKSADQIQSFNTFLGHAKDLSDAVDTVRNSQYPWINKPLNWISKNALGHPEMTSYLAKIEPVVKEFESFLLNNRALYEEDRKSAAAIIDPNASPAQMQAAIKSFVHTAAVRLNQVNNRYKNTMHRDYPGLVAPENQQILNDFGGASAVKTSGGAQPNKHSDLGFVPVS